MKKLLINDNIHRLIGDIESAIKHGYFLTEKSSLVSVNGFHEIDLYKQDVSFPEMPDEEYRASIELSAYDANNVLKGMQPYIANGYVVANVNWLELGYKYIALNKPSHISYRVFTKDELENLEYDELKKYAKVKGLFNRSKSVMIAQLSKLQEVQND